MARGPAYPYVDLETAVDLLGKLYKFANRSPALIAGVAKEAWGWSPTSSTPAKAVAALKYFGLVEDGASKFKQIKVSDRGYRILVDDPASPQRVKALEEAALSPPQYMFCFSKWGADVPPSARSTLIFERGFVASTVDGFLKDYKATMLYAGITGGPENNIDDLDSNQDATATNAVGFADRAAAAASTIFAKAAGQGAQAPGRGSEASSMRQDVFSIDEGSVTIIWPKALSLESLADVKDWLEIVKRKIERSGPSKPSTQTKSDQEEQI